MNERAFVSHIVGRTVLQEAVRLLAVRGIPVLPLKGVYLQALAYADPAERSITDVDVLVPEPDYARAQTALREAGWTFAGSNVSESGWRSPEWALPLDLHRRLFSRGAFRLPTQELFARGRPDASVFGVEVVLADPRDIFAHLVGHFVKSRGGPDSEPTPLRDFTALASRFALEPDPIARHLVRSGLARAARYLLPLLAADQSRGFFEAVQAELPDDPVGSVLAAGLLGLRRHFGFDSPLAVLPGFALEPTLPGAMTTLALRAWDRRLDMRGEA